MDRRSFFGNISGSFLLGTAGGATAGALGVKAYDGYMKSGGKISYAEQGEDLIVARFFEDFEQFGITQPTYLDVGAHDPIHRNNTYLMYQKGSQGVLVEPNPALCSRLQRVRPRDTTLNIGIGVSAEAEADYYMIGGPEGDLMNTFSKEDAEKVQAASKGMFFIEKVIKMPLVNINTVIEQHFGGKAPNFLSTDVEGLDLEILKSMDFQRFRPDVLCVETIVITTDKVELETIRLLESKNYSVRGATIMNTIFVDNRLLSEPGPLTRPPVAKG